MPTSDWVKWVLCLCPCAQLLFVFLCVREFWVFEQSVPGCVRERMSDILCQDITVSICWPVLYIVCFLVCVCACVQGVVRGIRSFFLHFMWKLFSLCQFCFFSDLIQFQRSVVLFSSRVPHVSSFTTDNPHHPQQSVSQTKSTPTTHHKWYFFYAQKSVGPECSALFLMCSFFFFWQVKPWLITVDSKCVL